MAANEVGEVIVNSFTFNVHDVSAVESAKPALKTYEGINALLAESEGEGFRPVLSCSGYNSSTIQQITHHALLQAVHVAFAEHRSLVLSPDMLWITIVQGIAQHVRNNPEKLRNRLVSHQGRLELKAETSEFNPGSPESEWQGLIDNLGDTLRANIGVSYDQLSCDFSTTGALEKSVCAITILDAYEPYFEYVMYSICGIPTITLEGSPDDWQHLREKIEVLAHYEMDWWLSSLRPIFDHFVRAAKGDIDLEFWQNIYKLKKAYGWDRINGWAARLIPYLRLPSGLSVVPFRFKTESTTSELQMIGGFVGLEQVGVTMAIRPKLGWAVRQNDKLEVLLANLASGSKLLPALASDQFHQGMVRLADRKQFGGIPLPGAITTFYRKCNGVSFGAPEAGAFRSVLQLERINLPEESEKRSPVQSRASSNDEIEITVNDRSWLVFFDFKDGKCLAVDINALCKGQPGRAKNSVKKIDLSGGTSEIVFADISEALEYIVERAGCL